MTSELTALRIRAADKLVAFFEKQIFDGSLSEGDPLPPEREIVESQGVSRTVVREAVLALSNKGLVRASPGFRPVVAKPDVEAALDVVGSIVQQLLRDPNGVKNLFDMRIMMEVALVREAAIQATKTDISDLKNALSRNEAAISDSQTFFETDIDFHGVLYRVPRNPVLPAVHRAYTDWLQPQWSAMPRFPERNRKNYDAHAAIFDAILHRDPDQAEISMQVHLADAWAQVSATFKEH